MKFKDLDYVKTIGKKSMTTEKDNRIKELEDRVAKLEELSKTFLQYPQYHPVTSTPLPPWVPQNTPPYHPGWVTTPSVVWTTTCLGSTTTGHVTNNG